MELHRLDGFDAAGIDSLDIQGTSEIINGVIDPPEIAYEILDDNGNVVMYADMDENIYVINGLGGFFKKIGKGLKKFAKKVVKPVVKTFNRFLNPATILLRNGFLLAMKVNMMKVAEKLRYGYLSDAEARKRGGDMSRFAKMKKAVEKAEKIYELAGGKKKNLKKAILGGKGNKDKKVPLSGFALGNPFDDGEPTIYSDPFEKFVVESDPDTVEAFLNNEIEIDGLGAIATGTAMAAASSAVAGVAALVGKIGGIFTKAKEVKEQATSIFKKPKLVSSVLPYTTPGIIPRQQFPRTQSFIPFTSQRNSSVTATPENKSFIQKNKMVLILGGIAVVAGGVAIAMRSKKKTARPISGTPRKPKRSRQATTSRDELGRFTKGRKTRSSKSPTRKAPEKLIPKALL